MSRVFFDAMMFVYGMADHPQFAPHVRTILERCQDRGDTLLTSCLAVGEVAAGESLKAGVTGEAEQLIRTMGFQLIAFDERCIATFGRLRAEMRLKAPDAIHLACAAAAGTDMFLTNDRQLLQRRLYVPGIQFIGDFTQPVL